MKQQVQHSLSVVLSIDDPPSMLSCQRVARSWPPGTAAWQTKVANDGTSLLTPPAAGQWRQGEAINSVINQWRNWINKACWVQKIMFVALRSSFSLPAENHVKVLRVFSPNFWTTNDINILFKFHVHEFIFKRFTLHFSSDCLVKLYWVWLSLIQHVHKQNIFNIRHYSYWIYMATTNCTDYLRAFIYTQKGTEGWDWEMRLEIATETLTVVQPTFLWTPDFPLSKISRSISSCFRCKSDLLVKPKENTTYLVSDISSPDKHVSLYSTWFLFKTDMAWPCEIISSVLSHIPHIYDKAIVTCWCSVQSSTQKLVMDVDGYNSLRCILTKRLVQGRNRNKNCQRFINDGVNEDYIISITVITI